MCENDKNLKDKLILVAGGYGYGNMGDEAQCAATLQMLSLRYPGFQVRNLTPHVDYSFGAHPDFAHDYASPRDLAAIGFPSERVFPTHDDALFCEKAPSRELPAGPYVAVNFHFWKLPETERPALLARLRRAFGHAAGCARVKGRESEFWRRVNELLGREPQ